MKKRFNKFMLPPWLQTIKRIFGQFVIPICIFQAIRTILLPTIFDVLLLTLLLALALAFYFEIV